MENNSKSTLRKEQTFNEKVIKIEIKINKKIDPEFDALATATYIDNGSIINEEYYQCNQMGMTKLDANP